MPHARKKQLEETIQQIHKQIEDLQEQSLASNRFTGDEWVNNRQQQEKDTREKELARLRNLLVEKETELNKLGQEE